MDSDLTSAGIPADRSRLPATESRHVAGNQRPPRPWRPVLGLRWVAVVLALILLGPGISYVQALTYPGGATWQMRSVEWLRDHGGTPLVDRIENWYYTSNLPTGSAPNQASLPVAAPGVAAAGRSS